MRLAFARTYTRALTLACLMSEGASVHCFTLSRLNCLTIVLFCTFIMRNHEICIIWVIRWKIVFCVRWCYGYVFKIHARLHKDTIVKQQKGRRVPIQLQDAVNKEVSRLLQEGHIVKVQEIKEDVFLQPTVITVKKDRSVKIALDARELNKNVIKDKYPMPNLDNLMDMIAEHVEQGPGETFFTTLDMTYAYGQVELSEETSRHCNFQIIGEKQPESTDS